MRKFFRSISLIVLVLLSTVSPSMSTEPDPTQLWRTLIFGSDHLAPGGNDSEVFVIRLFGSHTGWGSYKSADGEMYKIKFFSADPMPTLVLTPKEYELFVGIHTLPENLKDEFMLIPFGIQNPTDFYEVMIDIDEFCNLQVTSVVIDGEDMYSLKVTTNDTDPPIVYLTQEHYDSLMFELDRTGPTLRFDEIEWGEE